MRRWHALMVALLLSVSTESRAEEADDVVRARELFVEGTTRANEMRWGEALARFEASEKLHAHAGTTYNIGICQRALGQYTQARATFGRAIEEHRVSAALAEGTVANIEAYLREIDGMLAVLDVTLAPATAAVTVDGRPLALAKRGAKRGPKPELVAGTLPAGRGRPPPAGAFMLTVDPGAHVFVLSRKGYEDVVVRKAVTPGSRERLELTLKRLPASLRVAASESGSAVAVDGVDVGVAPVTLKRPAGRYRVRVQKEGFDSYETRVRLHSAERVDLMARLEPEPIGVHEQWWFWLSIGSAVATTAVVTYFATRPEPERPPLDGGGLGWTIKVP